MSELSKIYVKNALALLGNEEDPRAKEAISLLTQSNIQAGLVDWLANPFVRSAMSILNMMQGNPKVKQAIKLLTEAGEEEEKASKKKKK